MREARRRHGSKHGQFTMLRSVATRVFTATVWPAVALGSLGAITAVAALWDRWAVWTLSFLNALLFLAVGSIIRDVDRYRASAVYFEWMFYRPAPSRTRRKLRKDASESGFHIVLPSFSILGDADIVNPGLVQRRAKVTIRLDSIIANNDSESAFLVAEAISKLTNGRFRASYVLDNGKRDEYPAIVLGLYSNCWTHDYWLGCSVGSLLLPLPRQAGFLVRAGNAASNTNTYVEFRPRSKADSQIDDFISHPETEVYEDYALIAKIPPKNVGADGDSIASMLLITSIAETGTMKLARWLSHDDRLERLLRQFHNEREFAVVFAVPHASGSGIDVAKPIFSSPAAKAYAPNASELLVGDRSVTHEQAQSLLLDFRS